MFHPTLVGAGVQIGPWDQNQRMLAFRVPMFGGKTVPWTFNKAIAPFVAFVRFLCVRLWGYYDDFIALDQSQRRLNKIAQKVLKPLLHWLNMMVAESKSCWTPSQSSSRER